MKKLFNLHRYDLGDWLYIAFIATAIVCVSIFVYCFVYGIFFYVDTRTPVVRISDNGVLKISVNSDFYRAGHTILLMDIKGKDCEIAGKKLEASTCEDLLLKFVGK